MRRLKFQLNLAAIPQRRVAPLDSSSPDGDLELLEKLGSGTVGVVRRARRKSDGKELAVKCILDDDEEMLQFARDEFRLLSSAQHPHVVAAEGIVERGPSVWILMELCVGGSLYSFVRSNGGPLAEKQSLLFFRHLLEAVSYLHQRRIVHRDLKPENCLIQVKEGGERLLKISDFNSAKLVGGGAEASAMLTDRGTHAYTAPELLLGKLWNESVDIWASGFILYFMLRSRLPFDSEQRSSRCCFKEGRLPEISWDGVSAPLRDLVLETLSVDMRFRPPAMRLLTNALLAVGPPEMPAAHSCEAELLFGRRHTDGAKPSSKLGSAFPGMMRRLFSEAEIIPFPGRDELASAYLNVVRGSGAGGRAAAVAPDTSLFRRPSSESRSPDRRCRRTISLP